MSILEKLKKRWNIDSTFQIVVIFIVFSLTGASIGFVKPAVFHFIGIPEHLAWWWKILSWLFIVFPMYYALLLVFGTLLGQRQFFWWFAKKAFKRFVPKKRNSNPA